MDQMKTTQRIKMISITMIIMQFQRYSSVNCIKDIVFKADLMHYYALDIGIKQESEENHIKITVILSLLMQYHQ